MSDYVLDYASVAPDTDLLSQEARKPGKLDMDQLLDLYRQTPSAAASSTSSAGTPSDPVFSSHRPSTGTKPTSGGSSYPVLDYNGGGKALATYASSSMSAEHGSGSESEVEKEQNTVLAGVGDWIADDAAMPQTLKRAENSRRRPRPRADRRSKAKKPQVVLHHYDKDEVHYSSDDDRHVGRRFENEEAYRRRHTPCKEAEKDGYSLEASHAPLAAQRALGGLRVYILLTLIIAILLTFSLAASAAHRTGRQHMECTEAVIYTATVLNSAFIVLAVCAARWALHTALLAGLFHLVIGMVLLFKIKVFMHA